MVKPRLMCRKHLLGEHVEIHMFVGSILKGVSMRGYIEGDLMEPAELEARHAALVKEMEARGYRHVSEFQVPTARIKDLMEAKGERYNARVNRNLAKTELFRRCEECASLNRQYKEKK